MAASEPQAAPVPEAAPAPKKKGRLMPMVVVGGLMTAEGAGVFFVTKAFFGAQPAAATGAEHEATPAHGEDGGHGDHGDKPAAHGAGTSAQAEIELTDCKPSNRVSGKLITLRIRVSALVASAETERAKQLAEANKARINDRVNVVIRSADPKELNEPGLETIKRRLKHELAKVLGDEKLIQEILIPEMLQSGSGL
jgi:flagellar basal body-associated protein FliL